MHSARMVLWLPILWNVLLVSFYLHQTVAEALILGLALCSTASFGFLINDLRDLPVDKINRAGKLENASDDLLYSATITTRVFLSCGLLLSAMLGLRAFLAIAIVASGLAAYTFWIRPRLLLANLLAATLASTPIWLPNIVFNSTPNFSQTCIIAIAGLLLLGREIIFDIADMRGDAHLKRRTISLIFGGPIAHRVAFTLQIIACLLLMTLSALEGLKLGLTLQLILLTTTAGFLLLVVPVNLELILNPQRASLFSIFTARTRLAMLLMPILLLVLLRQ